MMEIGIVLIVLMMLACPLVMGAMMLMMWRGMRHKHRTPDPDSRASSLSR
jgi:hypothetical protein